MTRQAGPVLTRRAKLTSSTSQANRDSYAFVEDDANLSPTQHNGGALHRSASSASTKVTDTATPSRGGTLKKRGSLKKRASLGRSGSKRSMRAGSMKNFRDPDDDFHSIFATPVPTTGSPTELLGDRFQGKRKRP